MPSRYSYQTGCDCEPCTEANRVAVADYRARRRANNGQPLTNQKRPMPSLITRLRRDIGIVAPWRS